MKRGLKGFTAVEVLLALILMAILGFTGYYVYHSRHSADSTHNSTTKSTTSSTVSSTPQSFYFKELGVYVTLTSPPLKGNLGYGLSASDGIQYLDLYTPATQDALNKCAPGATSGTFMSIAKIPGQFNQNDNPGVTDLKQFKDFWISGAAPNGIVCADTASQADTDNWHTVAQTHYQAVVDAFKSATQ